MKGTLFLFNNIMYKLFMVLFLGGVIQGNADEVVTMGFNLAEDDKDVAAVQNLLIHKAYLEVDSKEACPISFEVDGEVVIKGSPQKIYSFTEALGSAVEKVATEEMAEEAFQKAKGAYLASIDESKALHEKELAGEISWENALQVQDSLRPLAKMLYSVASGFAEKSCLTLVANTSDPQLFHQLPISVKDQGHISKLIKKLGDSGYAKLWTKQKEMKKLGDKVRNVHPLRFLGYVYSNPGLKDRMRKVMKDKRKRKGFLDGRGTEGFGDRMNREMDGNNLLQYLPGFAQSLGVDPAAIEQYCHRRNWEGLLSSLL